MEGILPVTEGFFPPLKIRIGLEADSHPFPFQIPNKKTGAYRNPFGISRLAR